MPTINVTIFEANQPGATDPDADLKQSPLWPLQQDVRAGFTDIANDSTTTTEQMAVVVTPRSDSESLFGQWRTVSSLTKLRGGIQYAISPPYLDLANDPTLSSYQSQILASAHWNDALPS